MRQYSFEVSVPCTLARHHASHVPCDVSSRRCFLLQTQAVLYFGLPMLTDESLLRYSYAIASLLVAVFSALRFSRIPAAQALWRMSTISLPSVVYLHGRRSFEAARNDASLGLRLFLPKHTHMPTIPFDVLPRRSGTPRRVFSACFLRSGSSVMASVKNMIPSVE